MTASIADYQNAAQKSALNITTSTLVKAGPGAVLGIAVLSGTVGSGTINDCTTIAAAASGNQVAAIPSGTSLPGAPTTMFASPVPCLNGIVVVPPAGGAVSVFYA